MLINRCGTCENCRKLERIQKRVLACCNPPFSHADQDVVDLWNRELAEHPCLDEDDDAWLDQPERYDTDIDGALIDKKG
jgi:hypothetical protein